MSAASLLAHLKPSSHAPRTIFIKCIPTPTTFYERRAVFVALQRASQQSIETFKKLQGSSSFIAMTANPDAATSLIASSPLEGTVVSQDSSSSSGSSGASWFTNFDASGSIVNPVNFLPVDSEDGQSTPAYAGLGLSSKTFTLHIFPANAGYDNKEEIKKNPLYGQWPGDGRAGDSTPETFISAALKRVIPSGAMAPALRDWETGNQLARDADSFSEDGSEGAAVTLLGKKRFSARRIFFMERLRRRDAEMVTPEVMNSLVQFTEKHRHRPKSQPQDFNITATDAPKPDPSHNEADVVKSDASNDTQQSSAKVPPTKKTDIKKSESLLDHDAFKKMFDY